MRLPGFGRGAFLRNIATLAGATAVSQVAIVATGPVLSRLYSPDAWGRFGLVMAFVSVASVVTALMYDQAIVGTRHVPEAATLTVATLWLGPLVSGVACGVLALFIAHGWFGYGSVPMSAVAWSFALLVVMQVFVSLRYWHLRAERFALLGRTAVTQNLARAVAPIGGALLFPGWVGLAAGETVARTVGLTPLFSLLGGEFRRFAARAGWRRMAAAMRRYLVFVVLGVPSGLLNAIAQALPLPLLAAGFGAEAAGQFALAQRVLQAPLALVGRSAADAFHARLAIHVRERPAYARAFFFKTATVLLAAAIVPAAIVVAAGSRGFGWVFGARWAPAGGLAIAMLPWAIASLVVTPLSRAVFVLGGQRGKLIYDTAAVGLVAGAFAMAERLGWSLGRTVLVLSVAQGVAYLIYFGVLLEIVGRGLGGRGTPGLAEERGC